MAPKSCPGPPPKKKNHREKSKSARFSEIIKNQWKSYQIEPFQGLQNRLSDKLFGSLFELRFGTLLFAFFSTLELILGTVCGNLHFPYEKPSFLRPCWALWGLSWGLWSAPWSCSGTTICTKIHDFSTANGSLKKARFSRNP